MIGFAILLAFFGLFAAWGVTSLREGTVPRRRLPPPTLDHEPRLLALVERVEAEERRQKAGCGLEVCSVHDLAVRTEAERKEFLRKFAARAHELGIEPSKLKEST